VLQRKHDLGDKISDVMSFVSNSENIWEFLGTERDWHELGINSNKDELLLELISKDHLELEKLKLKKDAELLNKMIIIDEKTGEIYSRKELLPLARKTRYYKNDNSTSDDEPEIEEENEIFYSPDKKVYTPQK
jgi:hypothetical protein